MYMQQKQKAPAALRQSIWLRWVGKKFESKCSVTWCRSVITPFTFEAGHNIPESKGGDASLENMRPVCGVCNKSMGNRFTIDEFNRLYDQQKQTPSWVASATKCCHSEPMVIE